MFDASRRFPDFHTIRETRAGIENARESKPGAGWKTPGAKWKTHSAKLTVRGAKSFTLIPGSIRAPSRPDRYRS